MDIKVFLLSWFVTGVILDALLWGSAGALLIAFVSNGRKSNFFILAGIVSGVYFLWDSVIFSGLMNDLNVTVGNQEAIELLGTAKINFSPGWADALFVFVQITTGFAVGNFILNRVRNYSNNR